MKQQMKKPGKKISARRLFVSLLAVFLALLMILPLIFSAFTPPAAAVSQQEIDALKKNAGALAAQKKAAEQKIAELKKDRSKAAARKAALDEQNAILEAGIKNTEEQIVLYGQLIEKETLALGEAIRQEEEQFALFCSRMRTMEEQGTVSYLAVIFGASDFNDLLDRLGFVSEVVEYDNAVYDMLIAAREQVEEKKAELEETKAGLEAARVDLDLRQEELRVQIAEATALVVSIMKEEAEYASVRAEMEAEEERVAAEIDRLVRELAAQNNNIVSEAGYLWPLNGYYYISSPFGNRPDPFTSRTTFHNGVDIPAPRNTKVTAARSGVVLISQYNSSYGNYVVINHGKNEITLYAHLNSRAVAVDAAVKQGDVIGYVGTTGRSTGNHLHYEVRIGGERVNPLKFHGNLKFTGLD